MRQSPFLNTWEGIYGGGRQRDSVGGKLEKGAEELGAADEDPGTGGGKTNGIWDVLQCGSTRGVAFWGQRHES